MDGVSWAAAEASVGGRACPRIGQLASAPRHIGDTADPLPTGVLLSWESMRLATTCGAHGSRCLFAQRWDPHRDFSQLTRRNLS